MRVMTFTTVPVKPDTLRRLRGYKTGGRSYDDVLNDLMDEHPPEAFIREHLRRVREEPRIPWDEVKAELEAKGVLRGKRSQGLRKASPGNATKVRGSDRPARRRSGPK